MAKPKGITDAVQIMNLIGGDDPERQARLDVIRHQHRLARALYKYRHEQGLTQAELAQLVGTSQSTIARLERGQGSAPNLATLVKIGYALGQRLEVDYKPLKPSKSR